MRCKFKKPTGSRCDLPALTKKNFCCLHDPDSASIFFIKDFEKYKKNEAVFDIAKAKAAFYVKSGVAIRLDRKLYNRLNKID